MSPFTLAPRVWFSRLSLWLVIAFTFVLLVVVPLTQVQRREAALLAREGLETSAEVVDHQISTRRRNGTTHYTYYLQLRFVTESGQQVRVRQSVSQSEYNDITIGSRIPLRYAASDPEVTEREAGDTANNALGLEIAVVLSAAALLVSLVILWRSLSAQARAAQGERRLARIVSHKRVGKKKNGPLQAEWLSADGSGWTRGHKEAKLPAVGSDVTMLIDPRSGRGWWEGDY